MHSFIGILDLLLGLDNQLDGTNYWRTSYLYESYFMSMNELILIDIILYKKGNILPCNHRNIGQVKLFVSCIWP